MIGYDLDGVLAAKPPLSEKPWGRMNGAERRARKAGLVAWYRGAKEILHPSGEFIVITARKEEKEVVGATIAWFEEKYGAAPPIFFLNSSRTVENVINFKAQVLRHAKVSTYYEDNKKVLDGLKLQYPNCNYFFVDKEGNCSPYP